MKALLLGIFSVFLIVGVVFAKEHDDKIYWCHTEPNGNQETLHLPKQALEKAGHVDAQGNVLHAGDHAGECIVESPEPSFSPTPSPTASPTSEPSPSPSPENEKSPEPSLSPSPTPAEPTLAPQHDNRSDGYSSDPGATIVNYSDEHPEKGRPSLANK